MTEYSKSHYAARFKRIIIRMYKHNYVVLSLSAHRCLAQFLHETYNLHKDGALQNEL